MISSPGEKYSALKKASTPRANALGWLPRARTTASAGSPPWGSLPWWRYWGARSYLSLRRGVSLRACFSERKESLLTGPLPEQERRGVVQNVGSYRGQKTARPLVEEAEQQARPDRPQRPREVPAIGARVEGAEEDRGDHEPEQGLQSPPEKGLFAYAGEHRDQDEIRPPRAVHEARGEFVGDLAQRRQQAVEEGPRSYGAAG